MSTRHLSAARPRSTLSRVAAALAAAVLLTLLLDTAPVSAGSTVAAPVYLAALADGDLALAGAGGLYLVDTASGKARSIARLGAEVRGLAAAGDAVAVALGGTRSRVVTYGRDGRLLRTWDPLPAHPVGALAAEGERLYVIGTTGFQIYRLDSRSRDGGTAVARVYGARSIGALVRAPGGTFYVADPSQGLLLAVTEGSRSSLPLAEDAGTPVALAVDTANGRLLALDGLNGLLWSVILEAPRQATAVRNHRVAVKGDLSYRTADRARRLATLRDWQAPVALAATPDGTIWWADGGSGELVRLDPAGKEVARHRLPWATGSRGKK